MNKKELYPQKPNGYGIFLFWLLWVQDEDPMREGVADIEPALAQQKPHR